MRAALWGVAGMVSALALCGMSVAVWLFVTLPLSNQLALVGLKEHNGLLLSLCGVVSATLTWFVMGLVCAFFWRRVWPGANSLYNVAGAIAVALMASSPLWWFDKAIWLPWLPLVMALFVLQGVEFGLKWWPQQAWHAFFGLTNDYERDPDSKP